MKNKKKKCGEWRVESGVKGLVTGCAVGMVLALSACGTTTDTQGSVAQESKSGTIEASALINGGFEEIDPSGKWVGWTRNDAAFNARGCVDSDKVNGVEVGKTGDRFFSGTDGGNQVMRGTLTSNTFTLGGTGTIAFKIGAGKDKEKCFVEFFEEGNATPIAHVANDDCDGESITDQLMTKTVDLSAYVGKNVYIVATDNDDGEDYSYLNLDDFRVCETQADIDAAVKSHEDELAAYFVAPYVEDETLTTIENGDFENGDLYGWTTLDGNALTKSNVVPMSQYYWTDRAVYGHGDFYLDGSNNGATPEDRTGAIRSSKFTLAGDGYISFMIGAAPSNAYVALCDAATDEELITMGNDTFSDPVRALMLMRKYMDASAYIGKVCYIKVVDANDGSSGGFAFINVDDVRVSLTKEEVAALEQEQIDALEAETYTSASYDDLATLRDYYNTYEYLVPLSGVMYTQYVPHQVMKAAKDVNVAAMVQGTAKATAGGEEVAADSFTVTGIALDGTAVDTADYAKVDLSKAGAYTVTYTATAEAKPAQFTLLVTDDDRQVANGGFETGNLAGWTPVEGKWGTTDGQYNGVISAETYWDQKMPYNQAGDYHLDGWNTGIDEPDTWQLQSSNFTLGGSGFISVKMGGNASAVKVFTSDGTQVGYYKSNRFCDENFPSLAAGGSWADMGTYVMDLSKYKGKELYIVLCDEPVDAWAQAFFDDVVTYYEEAPAVADMKDTVADGETGDPVDIPWQLVESEK